jgi:hypothetical protein
LFNVIGPIGSTATPRFSKLLWRTDSVLPSGFLWYVIALSNLAQNSNPRIPLHPHFIY